MIEQFFTWPLLIERRLGTTGKGVRYAPPETVMAKIRMVSEMVTTSDGDTVTSAATAQTFHTIDPIPTGSRGTLPAALDPSGRKLEVIQSGLHDTGLPHMPRFYEIKLGGGA